MKFTVLFLFTFPLSNAFNLISTSLVRRGARCITRKNKINPSCLPPHHEFPTNLKANGIAVIEYNNKHDDGEAPPIKFTTHPTSVYIEDTDAYGVVLNSNYIRYFERALNLLLITQTEPDHKNKSAISLLFDEKLRNCWYISSIHDERYKSSPLLGDRYVIVGELIGKGREMKTNKQILSEKWKLHLQDYDVDGNTAKIHNSVIVTVTSSSFPFWDTNYRSPKLSTSSSSPLPPIKQNDKQSFDIKVTPHRDDFCPYHPPTHLPFSSVLNMFERSRSSFLGGPEGLVKMKNDGDDGIVWVVSSLTDCHLLHLQGESDKKLKPFVPGSDAIVRTSFTVKRKGMIVECDHSLLFPTLMADGTEGKIKTPWISVAKGISTIVALNGKTRRPSSNLPSWLKKKIGVL